MHRNVPSDELQRKVMRFFWVVFIVGLVFFAFVSILPYPFQQIALACGFSSLGFGFGLFGTLSIMQNIKQEKPQIID